MKETMDLEESNILYELLVYAEWQQEPEILNKKAKDVKVSNGYVRKLMGRFAPELRPPLIVRQLTNLLMPWAVAIGGNGTVIAVLQDTSLEIRTSRDEYGAIIGRTQVNKDLFPQWRKILWSPDCTMLACAYSNGTIDVYDLIGAHMFTIESTNAPPSASDNFDFSHSIVGMAFTDVRVKNTQWSYELLVCTYAGNIFGYFVSPSEGFKTSHQFSFSSCYPAGITDFTYRPSAHLLVVCGFSQKLSTMPNDASHSGLSAWRFLSDFPYYKLAMSSKDQMNYLKSSWWDSISNYNLYHSLNQDLVFKSSISPNGDVLACIHISGALSMWDLPTLRLKKRWPLQLQPGYADINPEHSAASLKKRANLSQCDAYYSHIIDINWWSDDALIMVRRCGAVTVSSIRSLQNLLGISPEWFEPSPAVTSSCNRGFLAIEKETRLKGKRRSIEDSDPDEDDSSDEEDSSVFAYSYDIARRTLYFITDSDRFQPLRRKSKLYYKIYRLLCLKSTTPEELYTRKINNEEYGEALALAKTYKLDSDLVYQRQWRKKPATVESIHDYLSKITKRSWVLHECMERVPESIEAAKELLDYGLQGTDVKALVAIGKGQDQGRFILSNHFDESDDFESLEEYGMNHDADDIFEIKKIYLQKKREEALKNVNFKKLNLEQKQLCQCRLKLLFYLDRLTAYEIILGGSMYADDRYDQNFFKKFRSECGFESAIHFACNSDWEAVVTLFTYLGLETLSHRLTILSHFPETMSPVEYQSLLPMFNERDSAFYPWDEHSLREPDWSEGKLPKHTANDEYVAEFYEKYSHFLKYRQSQLDPTSVTDWFIERAKEIESRSGLVENALMLLKLGMERYVQGLEKLYDDLKTFEVLIYSCEITSDIDFKEYNDKEDFEKLNLIMSTTSKENFIKNMNQWLLPFLSICDKYEVNSGNALFKKYVLSLSVNDLFYIKKILENLKYDMPPHIMSDFDEFITLGLNCIYICESTGELKNANAIHDLLVCLPEIFNRRNRKPYCLPDTVISLKRELQIAGLLDKNGLTVTIADIQKISKCYEEVKKLLTKLTRMAGYKTPVLEEEDWKSLLSDILDMQKMLFKCVSYEDCFEIVLQSLLCSGRYENIALAGKMMECGTKQRKRQIIGPVSYLFPYVKSTALVLAASKEYFNSSSNAADPCMSLARACLNLIEDITSSIEEEFDLISAMSLLQDLNVNILPLQVRVCENRMDIIEEALQKKPKNYKKSKQIMRLAYLLRTGGNNTHKQEGEVLILLGEYAFQAEDYNECLSACQKLIENGHKDGWQICYTLGECSEFSDITVRTSLMSFAMAYCSEDLIETILLKRSELQLQVLQERVKFLVGDSSPLSSDYEENNVDGTRSSASFIGPLRNTTEKTFHVIQNTTQTAKGVLTSVRSAQFWKDAVNVLTNNTICWIPTSGFGWSSETSDIDEKDNSDLSRIGVPAFYDSLVQDAHISRLEANYQRFARPDLSRSLEIASTIFRAACIQDSIKLETSLSCLEQSVLLDIAKAYIPEDTVYSFFILLNLKQLEKAEALFISLPRSPIALQLASLYYATNVYIRLKFSPFSDATECVWDPPIFIQEVLDYEKDEELSVKLKADNVREHFKLLQKYHKLLYDFVQAEILQSIGGGVDATRFTNDDVYKKDTILGIAMTLDDSVFQIAISLANYYKISTWDVYMTHLEYLFSESNVTAATITERLENLNLLDNLITKKKELEVRLKSFVYPGLSGKEHEKLLIYFSILEKCGDKEDGFKITPSLHKQLLTKLRAALSSIDYKLATTTETSETYFMSIIAESNVHAFAKISSNIPKQKGGFYEPSDMYCLWAKRFFYEGNSANSTVPTNKTEWIHRYENCGDLLQKLNSTDVVKFVDGVIFSTLALDSMSVDCRSEILKRTTKFCRSRCAKHKNNILLSTSWSDAATILNTYHMHLRRLEDETFIQLGKSYDPKIKEYCKDFDLSKSFVEKLQDLLAKIVIEGPDLELLKTFLSCCPPNVDWVPSDAYIKAINIILQQMKQPQDSKLSKRSNILPIQALEAILKDISEFRDELMIEDTAAEILNEFCQMSDVSVSIRLCILQLLEKSDFLSPEYGDLLLLYRTQAVVSSMWPEQLVCEEEVKSDYQRKILFDTLLSLCSSVDQFRTLAKLLNQWPPFLQSENISNLDEPWLKFLSALISISTKDALDTAVDVFGKAVSSPSFTLECCEEVFKKFVSQQSILHILKCALKTKHSSLHSNALQILLEMPELTEKDYDNELLDLLLQHKLAPEIVATDLYKPVVEFMLHCQDDNVQESYKSIDSVVKQLYEAGHESEAGSLLLIKNSVHTSLSTFSSAISVLNSWLSNDS